MKQLFIVVSRETVREASSRFGATSAARQAFLVVIIRIRYPKAP